MYIGSIFLSMILLFSIIYFAVRLAIKPLLYKPDQVITYEPEFELVKLRDIDVLSPSELEEVIEMYNKKCTKKQGYEEFEKYKKVLDELKEMDYFISEEYLYRMEKLKKYFNVD